MTWPRLVFSSVCETQITLHLTRGTDAYGAPIPTVSLTLPCNFQSQTKPQQTNTHAGISFVANAYFDGDIAPGVPLTGTAQAFGETYQIAAAQRARNPDGSVNFTRLCLC